MKGFAKFARKKSPEEQKITVQEAKAEENPEKKAETLEKKEEISEKKEESPVKNAEKQEKREEESSVEDSKTDPKTEKKKPGKRPQHPKPKRPSFFQIKINIEKPSKGQKENEKKNEEGKESESADPSKKVKLRHILFAGLVGSLFLSFVSDIFSDKNTITYFVPSRRLSSYKSVNFSISRTL